MPPNQEAWVTASTPGMRSISASASGDPERSQAALAAALLVPTLAAAEGVDWRLVRPSNTGIPGEEVRFAKWGPDGKLWVAGRWPFWREGGLAAYDLDSQLWTTWGTVDSPIPSEWVNDLEFAADGSLWLATGWVDSRGGLVHKSGDDWTVFAPVSCTRVRARAPLVHVPDIGTSLAKAARQKFGARTRNRA